MESPRRVTLLIGRNGSVQLLPEDEDEDGGGGGGGGGGSGGLVALLALTFTFGLALNAAVALAVATEPTLRKALFLRCLATLAVANALDCALNVTIASIAITSWLALSARSAANVCRVSAVTSQVSVLSQTFAVFALVLERASAVAVAAAKTAGDVPSATSRLASAAAAALLWFGWPTAMVLATGPAVVAPVRLFPNRYGCGIAGPPGPALWLPVSTLVIGFLIPWVCTALVLGGSVRHVTRHRWRRQQLELAAQRRAANTAQAPQAPPPPLWFTSNDSMSTGFGWNGGSAQLSLAAVLLFLYVTLLIPQILTTLTFQLARVPLRRHAPPATPDQWPANTGAYETVFVWMRFQFAIVSPGLVLLFHKEVRQRVGRMLTCLCRICYCRRGKKFASSKNAVAHVANETCETAADARTPVLFATDQGLFLRVTDHMWADTPDEASTTIGGMGVTPAWPERDRDGDPRYVFQFCDVALLEEKASAAGQLRPLFEDEADLSVGAGHNASRNKHTLNKPYKMTSDSCRKNVRFASVVNEIPSSEIVAWTGPEELGHSAVMPTPPLATPTDSPIRWLARSKRTSLEMELVTEGVMRIAPPSSSSSSSSRVPSSGPSTPRVVDSSTFSLPTGKKLYPRTSHV